MTIQILSVASVLLYSFCLRNSICIGSNACTDCYRYNGICNVTSVGYSVPMGGRTDLTLVRKLKKGDTVIHRNLQCVNHGYILAGNVSEHICFWTLPSKCEAVVPEDVIKNKVVVRTVCRSCAYYCNCALLKDMGASLVHDIRTMIICISLGMLTKFSVFFL